MKMKTLYIKIAAKTVIRRKFIKINFRVRKNKNLINKFYLKKLDKEDKIKPITFAYNFR